MKMMIFVALALLSMKVQGQFHVRVVCNPGNYGMTNPRWVNNYVIEYSTDNWQHSSMIRRQLTYSGFRDDGSTFYTSYYERYSFQKLSEAVNCAKQFRSLKRIHRYDSLMLEKHRRLLTVYNLQNKKHPIHTKKQEKSLVCDQVTVY